VTERTWPMVLTSENHLYGLRTSVCTTTVCSTLRSRRRQPSQQPRACRRGAGWPQGAAWSSGLHGWVVAGKQQCVGRWARGHAKNIDLGASAHESTRRRPVGSVRGAGVYVSFACHSTGVIATYALDGRVPGGCCIGGAHGQRRLSATPQRDDSSVCGVRVRGCVLPRHSKQRQQPGVQTAGCASTSSTLGVGLAPHALTHVPAVRGPRPTRPTGHISAWIVRPCFRSPVSAAAGCLQLSRRRWGDVGVQAVPHVHMSTRRTPRVVVHRQLEASRPFAVG